MSTRFKKQIIMPQGSTGITTLMDLSDEDRKSVERWHRNEWHEFVAEVKAYKIRALTKWYDIVSWNRENCVACRKIREIRSPKYQRGSIMMGAAGASTRNPISSECTYTASTIPDLSDFKFSPGDAYTRARLHSDGDWYSHEGSNSWSTSDGTWQGSCAVADYETRWVKTSGDAPNNEVSGVDGVWSVATTSKAVGYAELVIGNFFGVFSLECRGAATATLYFTDTFSMSCDVEI